MSYWRREDNQLVACASDEWDRVYLTCLSCGLMMSNFKHGDTCHDCFSSRVHLFGHAELKKDPMLRYLADDIMRWIMMCGVDNCEWDWKSFIIWARESSYSKSKRNVRTFDNLKQLDRERNYYVGLKSWNKPLRLMFDESTLSMSYQWMVGGPPDLDDLAFVLSHVEGIWQQDGDVSQASKQQYVDYVMSHDFEERDRVAKVLKRHILNQRLIQLTPGSCHHDMTFENVLMHVTSLSFTNGPLASNGHPTVRSAFMPVFIDLGIDRGINTPAIDTSKLLQSILGWEAVKYNWTDATPSACEMLINARARLITVMSYSYPIILSGILRSETLVFCLTHLIRLMKHPHPDRCYVWARCAMQFLLRRIEKYART